MCRGLIAMSLLMSLLMSLSLVAGSAREVKPESQAVIKRCLQLLPKGQGDPERPVLTC